MSFRLILLISFILFEPFLPVKAFYWSNISYQFLLWILLLGLFDWSGRAPGERLEPIGNYSSYSRRIRGVRGHNLMPLKGVTGRPKGRPQEGVTPIEGNEERKATNLLVSAGLVCAVFFRPSICGLAFPWSNSFYLLLISGIFLISFLGRRELVWRKTPLDIPIISFLILATAYLILSLDRMTGLRQVISLWGAGILYFTLAREIKERNIAGNMILVFLLGGLRIMVNGLYQFWVGLSETRIWIETYTQGELGARLLERLSCGRVFSNFVYPNAYAGFLIMLIPVVFSLLWHIKGYKKIGVGSFLGLSFFSLFLTYSKGGWLSLALTSLFAFVFIFPRFKIFQKIFILFIILILIYGLVMALESTGSTKLGFTKSFKARWEYWQASLRMIRNNPLRGYGLGNFGEFYAQYKLPEAEETRMAHNNYLQVWVEMGFLGFFILLWLVFNYLKLGLCSFRGAPELSSLFQGAFWGGVAFFIHSLVDFDFYVPNLLFSAFFLIGIAVSLNSRAEECVLFKKRGPRLLYFLSGAAVFLVILFNQSNYLNHLFAMERINELVSTSDFQMAEKEIEDLLNECEFNPALHFEKGNLKEIRIFNERKKSDFADAVYEYSLASNLNPFRAGYHFRLARLYWALRDEPFFLKKAVSEFKLSHEAYPAKKEYRQALEGLKQYLGKHYEK